MTDNMLLAFVHIEKAAGTSLIHILRRNFLLHYLDARPIKKESENSFCSRDLAIALNLNPSIACIGGHAVRPYSGLDQRRPTKYITLVRDPVKRYISHYRYWNRVIGHNMEFREFLSIDSMSNFQTKKIAGAANFEFAKKTLLNQFLIAGLVERFDDFLILLRAMLERESFSTEYVSRNVAATRDKDDNLLADFYDEIIERNEVDIQLYEFVRDQLFPSYLELFPLDILSVEKPATQVANLSAIQRTKSYVDYAYRKLYCEPVLGSLRLLNGRSYSGHY